MMPGSTPIEIMDHFFQIGSLGPPEHEMLESYATLGYLAANTSRARLITIVTGVVYRYPGVLAKTVATLDVLSGGRAMLGIGAAWNAYEAKAPAPPVAERFEWLEDTLQLCLQMWKGDESRLVGKRFRFERPLNSPQSLTRPHPPIREDHDVPFRRRRTRRERRADHRPAPGAGRMGFTTAIGGVKDVWKIAPLEIMAREIIPTVGAF
jgi:hypothetical protein